MAEKVKQLAKQAGFVLWRDENWKPEGQVVDWSSDYDKELKKFAELIVTECAEVVQEGEWTVPPSQEQLARSIKRHFGVEE